MKIKVVHTSPLSHFAYASTGLFLLFIALKLSAIGFPLPTPIIALFGLLGMALSITSIIKEHDRSLCSMISVFSGLIILLWIIMEFLFPH